jgi:multiple antibiotic resistance protein
MVIFAVLGRYILEAFGVDLNAFRIAGGILLVAIAIDTLRTGTPRVGESGVEEFILVPVVTPLLVGPGTITTLILFSATYPVYQVVIASIVSAAVTYVIIRLSGILLRRLGGSFLRLLGRFMSLIIAALAVDMVLTGASNYVLSIMHR